MLLILGLQSQISRIMKFCPSKLISFLLAMTMSITAMPMNVLFIGDSITDGNWGSPVGWPCPSENRSHSDLNHIYGHGFVEMTAAYYLGTYPEAGFSFYNRGISGNTLADLARRWGKDALALAPDVVSILIGTNDINEWLDAGAASDFDYATWEQRYRNLLDLTRCYRPEVKIVLATPFTANAGWVGKRADYAKRAEAISRLDDIVRRIATDYDAVLVDFAKLVADLQQAHPDLAADYWIWDGIHPTSATHYQMAQLWRNSVKLR
jgi:lysophospholipase L1-like esterase